MLVMHSNLTVASAAIERLDNCSNDLGYYYIFVKALNNGYCFCSRLKNM